MTTRMTFARCFSSLYSFSTWNQILWKNLHWWLIITLDYLAKSYSYSSKLHNSTHIFLVSNDYSILYEQKCTHKNIMSLNVFIIFEFFVFCFLHFFSFLQSFTLKNERDFIVISLNEPRTLDFIILLCSVIKVIQQFFSSKMFLDRTTRNWKLN